MKRIVYRDVPEYIEARRPFYAGSGGRVFGYLNEFGDYVMCVSITYNRPMPHTRRWENSEPQDLVVWMVGLNIFTQWENSND